jgi:hypothetical protein
MKGTWAGSYGIQRDSGKQVSSLRPDLMSPLTQVRGFHPWCNLHGAVSTKGDGSVLKLIKIRKAEIVLYVKRLLCPTL